MAYVMHQQPLFRFGKKDAVDCFIGDPLFTEFVKCGIQNAADIINNPTINSQSEKKGFLDVLVDNYVVVYDEYNHDYVEHIIKVSSIECNNENITETNPIGKVCYGDDISISNKSDEFITVATESNFVRFANESEIPRQIRAINIKWSMHEFAIESLGMPEVVIIPDEYMTDEDAIGDWLSDKYGFCHGGFELVYLTNYDLKIEEEKLKRAIHDSGVNAVEDFLGYPLDNDDIDIWAEMNNVIAQMPDEEYLKYLVKYCGSSFMN